MLAKYKTIMEWLQPDPKLENKRKEIRAFVMDESIPFSQRLHVWLETPAHLYDEDSWYVELPAYDEKYGEISWYDDFNKERYAVVDLREIYQQLKEDIDADDLGDCRELLRVTDFATECMALGHFAFTNDW